MRPVALAMIPEIAKRIHVQGKDSSGAQIGTYSSAYLRLRSGEYANADKNKKGVRLNSGKFTEATIRLNKNSGVFSGEDKVGKARPNYNRGTDPKVIISLTRQLENDYAVIATTRGYGIGFNNVLNYNKSQWVQETYGKKIFNLTAEEKVLTGQIVNELTGKIISE